MPEEEFARRGEEIFEREIKRAVKGKNPRNFVAIDITTGAFEVDANERAATERLYARLPDALPWLRRVGSPFAYHFGGHRRAVRK
jgi:hypothetical protein